MMRKGVAGAFILMLALGDGVRQTSAGFPRPVSFLARSVPLWAQQQQLEITTRSHTKPFLRILEDQQGAGGAGATNWYGSTTIKYETCYVDYTKNTVVQFHLCPAGTACDSACEERSSHYAANVDVFMSSFLGISNDANDHQNEDDDDDMANYRGNYYQNGCVEGGDDDCGAANGYAFDPSSYTNCVAFDEKFYVAPYCKDQQIYLGYYWDEDCSTILDDSFYYGLYGTPLEYSALSGYSLVNQTNSCATCSNVNVDEEDGGEEQEDGEEREDDDEEDCGSLLSYSISLRKENVQDEHESTHDKGVVLALVMLVAALALAGSFYACCKLVPSLWGKSEKEGALLSSPFKAESVACVSSAHTGTNAIRPSSPFQNVTRSPSDDETINSLGSQDDSILLSKASSC